MPFELIPVIDQMITIYQMPKHFDRFKAYLKLLQGNSPGDIELPIGSYNPMAGVHVIEKLLQLKEMGAEQMVTELSFLPSNDFVTGKVLRLPFVWRMISRVAGPTVTPQIMTISSS